MASTMNVCRTALLRRAVASAVPRSSSITSRTAFASSLRPSTSSPSFFSTSSASRNAAAPADSPSQDAAAATPAAEEGEGAAPAIVSSCPEGTVLVGLNYTKGRTDPVAKRDEEYPAWLWNCLDVMKKVTATEDADAGDEFSKSKKQRRMALKRQREMEAKIFESGDLSALAPKIPLQHQTLNLPVGVEGKDGKEATLLEDTLEAASKRKELRVALRKERRAKIKESNYLRSM
ncbi:hypothetical protein Sste5346_004607 [Sporothrix stenoceras]|uniref:Large ribosomal subunit protein mL54 n=1 Tax=Sporothrix stenoceras TaxID=5173 RepID=A0ABR3Z7D0_9PEZI